MAPKEPPPFIFSGLTKELKETDYKYTNLYKARNWYVDLADYYQDVTKEQCPPTVSQEEENTITLRENYQSLPEERPQDKICRERRQRIDAALQGLLNQITAEESTFRDIIGTLPSLRPQLSFQWLYHEKTGWVIELVLWTMIGVLINTLQTTKEEISNNLYQAKRFVLKCPDLLSAPILSIFAVAVLATGFTESGVLLQNLPYFLALSFALGFGSQRVTKIVQFVVNNILGGIVLSEEQLKKAAKEKDLNEEKYRRKEEEDLFAVTPVGSQFAVTPLQYLPPPLPSKSFEKWPKMPPKTSASKP